MIIYVYVTDITAMHAGTVIGGCLLVIAAQKAGLMLDTRHKRY